MLHPRLTAIGSSTPTWLATIGPRGSWANLSYATRWGVGASGMFEASWTMTLPPGFSHSLLRRGTQVELMDGPYRVGSPLIMSEPAVGSGPDDPWTITCAGIGREVEGENSFYCFDGSGNTTSIPSTAIDQAMVRGLRWTNRDATIPTTAFGGTTTTDGLMSIGSLLNAVGDSSGMRWGVGRDNIVRYMSDPTTPTYQVTPGAVALGTGDDDYATVVYVRYLNSATGAPAKATAPASTSATETTFGRREYPVDLLTDRSAMSTATAQGFADGILAKAKGRLAYTNGLTVTSNELLTMGGVRADLSKVLEDVGNGCMVRVHGISSDLLAYNGQMWLDIVIGEAKYVDGAQTIDLNPLGLAARDLAAIVEEITGMGDAA